MKGKLLIVMFPVLLIASFTYSQDVQVIFDDAPEVHGKDSSFARTEQTGVIDDTLRLLIVEKAREFIGVNYKWGQSNPDAFDCSGYVKYVYGQFGYTLPHSSIEQFHSSKRLAGTKAKPGDLVFFITRGHRVSHVGIYLGDNSFIHAPRTGRQVSIDSLDNIYFKKHLAGFGNIIN
ncbi:MAG TPA: C40 family peptidase [Bacteroidales bacterium]|nr:C40 family peptidase [Bacteroidales bacterium]